MVRDVRDDRERHSLPSKHFELFLQKKGSVRLPNESCYSNMRKMPKFDHEEPLARTWSFRFRVGWVGIQFQMAEWVGKGIL